MKRLLLAWEENYLEQPAQQPWLRLFRSLEVGFQAGRFPSDGLSSINDIGTRIGLWVSACEVLLRSDTDNIDKRLVQEAIGAVELSNPRLTRKRFNIQHRGLSYKVALPARIYDDMYRARNLFLHGNPVDQLDLRFGRSAKRARLVDLVLVVYSLALRAVLNARMAPDENDESDDFFWPRSARRGVVKCDSRQDCSQRRSPLSLPGRGVRSRARRAVTRRGMSAHLFKRRKLLKPPLPAPRHTGLDPIRWTRSERRIRCPECPFLRKSHSLRTSHLRTIGLSPPMQVDFLPLLPSRGRQRRGTARAMRPN